MHASDRDTSSVLVVKKKSPQEIYVPMPIWMYNYDHEVEIKFRCWINIFINFSKYDFVFLWSLQCNEDFYVDESQTHCNHFLLFFCCFFFYTLDLIFFFLFCDQLSSRARLITHTEKNYHNSLNWTSMNDMHRIAIAGQPVRTREKRLRL